MEGEAAACGARPVTTAKDMVRLEGLIDPGARWVVVPVRLEVDGGWPRLAGKLWQSVKRKGGG